MGANRNAMRLQYNFQEDLVHERRCLAHENNGFERNNEVKVINIRRNLYLKKEQEMEAVVLAFR